MYTLIGIYLLAPILSAWIEKASVHEIEIILFLWGVSLCYPIVENWLYINSSTSGVLYYFTGYAGYFLLGYYLKHYGSRLSIWIPTILTLIGITTILILKYKGIEFDFYRLFWYESIFIVSLCCLIWKIVVKLTTRAKFQHKIEEDRNFIITLSNLGFGIYLMHILIMRFFLWHIDWINSISNHPAQTIIIALLTILISAILCFLMAKTPVLNILIGYKISNSRQS